MTPIDSVKQLEPGERIEMPVRDKWEGVNQDLYYAVADYASESEKAFEIENERIDPRNKNKLRYWIKRTR